VAKRVHSNKLAKP